MTHYIRPVLFCCLLLSCLFVTACAHYHQDAPDNFQLRLSELESEAYSKIGVRAVNLDSGKRLEYREREHFKMASTAKLPIAVYLLHLVENKRISLNKMVRVEPQELVPGSGKMGYFLTKPGLELSIYNLLEPMIAISDNTATDVLLQQIGGPSKVRNFLEKRGFPDIWLSRGMMQTFIESSGIKFIPPQNERSLVDWKRRFNAVPNAEMAASSLRSYQDQRDTTTPLAMTELLTQLQNSKILGETASSTLLEIMSRTENGANRIKKLIPANAKLSHKTGTWWEHRNGIVNYNYTSDVGIITTPSGEHIAISVYTSSDRGSSIKKQEEAIAEIAKLAYEALQ